MSNVNIPKKYMMVFQKKYGGQDAVEFLSNATISTVPIKPFTDKKIKATTNKDSIVKKNTLAFYDAITNKFQSFEQFIGTMGNGLYSFEYKSMTSYVGYIDNGYMHRLSISFNDPILAVIALQADGNNINTNNKETIEIVTNIVDMIEDSNSDFVSYLQNVYNDKQDKRFNFSKSLIENIIIYHATIRIYENNSRECGLMDEQLVEDLSFYKSKFLSKVKSYKNFRELYRFRKQYIFDKESKTTFEKLCNEKKNQIKQELSEERYEETKQKSSPKQKSKKMELPGQISLFDIIDK